MRIRCKECGKRFDAEMYSGLCPKCGTYNDMRALDEGQRPVSERPASERPVSKRPVSKRPSPAEAARPEGGGGEPVSRAKERLSGGFRPALVFPVLFLLLPVLTGIAWFVWRQGFVKGLAEGEIAWISPSRTGQLLLEGDVLGDPIAVTVEGVDRVFLEGLIPEGMQLVCVKASVSSEEYHYDVGLGDISLAYGHGGDPFYREPLYADSIGTCLYALGLSEEDALSSYSPGNGEEESGYWFFLAHEDAGALELVLIAEDRDYPYRAVVGGRIPLEGIGSSGLAAEEVGQ